MKKLDLIKKLETIDGNPEVKIFDWRKNLSEDSGNGSSAGVYELEVAIEVLSDDEKDYYKEMNDRDYIPWIQLSFESEDYSDEGVKYD
ncbi:hypothetical protein [Chryseobacterium indoltheticum]|uniref:Uncharacterized protein n=1 Tax=Chryseobacterium indoltheticum TaxID=254 RepID=A0A3G6MYC1_9FLAO|nr:hypothetical protein [Chryseobacterium indoltheticum]AZA60790.1 hypothetical protein EG340_06930 [Chryseobacterium indoltheticum]